MSRSSHFSGTVICFLFLLASSVTFYVTVMSSEALVMSHAYQRHAISRQHEVAVQQNTASHNLTTWKNDTGSHHLISKNGKTTMNNSLTGSLWNFKDISHEQLFLYENLLKQKWRANITKTETLRQELAKYRSELGDTSQVILHQQNTKPKAKMKFVFNDKVTAMSPTIYKRLPKTNPFPKGARYRSCAVVGNSGIMLNSSCGGKIDKHDYVFRCNLAPLSPFKKDAGMKSNLTTMNPSILYRNYQHLTKAKSVNKFNEDITRFSGVIWVPCYNIFYTLSLVTKAFMSYKGKTPMMVCGNPKHLKSVVDFWVERELNNRISTGFFLVTTAIQLCDEVELFGFWPFSERYCDHKTDVPYHYFDDLAMGKTKSVHSMDKEFSLLVQLHNLGIVRLNVGSCS